MTLSQHEVLGVRPKPNPAQLEGFLRFSWDLGPMVSGELMERFLQELQERGYKRSAVINYIDERNGRARVIVRANWKDTS